MRNKARGYVTIIVIWVSIVLVVISAGLTLYVRSQYRAVINYENYMKSYYIAAAGAYSVIWSEFAQGGKLNLSQIGGINSLNTGNVNVPFGDGYYTAVFGDEGGKSNINTADVKVIRDLLAKINISDPDTKSQAIYNWKAQNGGLFFSIQELGLVPAIGINDIFTMLPYFSIFDADNVSVSVQALNINTAPVEVLSAYITNFGGSDVLAQKIVQKRPFNSQQELLTFARQNIGSIMRMNQARLNFFAWTSNVKSVSVTAGLANNNNNTASLDSNNGANSSGLNISTLVTINAVFNVWSGGGHENIFIRHFWQE
jgi:type II secretory pathway component PulK